MAMLVLGGFVCVSDAYALQNISLDDYNANLKYGYIDAPSGGGMGDNVTSNFFYSGFPECFPKDEWNVKPAGSKWCTVNVGGSTVYCAVTGQYGGSFDAVPATACNPCTIGNNSSGSVVAVWEKYNEERGSYIIFGCTRDCGGSVLKSFTFDDDYWDWGVLPTADNGSKVCREGKAHWRYDVACQNASDEEITPEMITEGKVQWDILTECYCNDGYYCHSTKSDSPCVESNGSPICIQCPANATCPAGTRTAADGIKCNAGYVHTWAASNPEYPHQCCPMLNGDDDHNKYTVDGTGRCLAKGDFSGTTGTYRFEPYCPYN